MIYDVIVIGKKLLCRDFWGKYKVHSQKLKRSVAIGDVIFVIVATLKVVHIKTNVVYIVVDFFFLWLGLIVGEKQL